MRTSTHVFQIQTNKTYIFDTGSPFSIGLKDNTANKMINSVYPNLFENIEELLGIVADGLLGCDEISKKRYYYNHINQTLSETYVVFDQSIKYQLDTYFNIPVIEVVINGKKHQFFIDTGSGVNYIKDSLLNKERDLKLKDYSPLLGWFESEGYQTTITSLGQTIETEIYKAPEQIEHIMGSNIDGILGYDFLSQFSWVLDLDNRLFEVIEGDM